VIDIAFNVNYGLTELLTSELPVIRANIGQGTDVRLQQ
jgi:hypothetical protein